ncbi:MAG TPA: hypothetical protein VF756_00190 [Thermoanaerobaculia bacterium]
MAREPKYGLTLNGWERLDRKLEQYMADFPHLEAPHLRLREMIGLGAELVAQQALHTAGKQEATQRLQELLAEGRKLVTFLRTGVKQHYGNRSEKLAEFDLQPFRGRKSPATPPLEKRTDKPPDPEKAE